MSRYGKYGRPIPLLEAYMSWHERQLEEAASKADFPEFLYGPVSTSVYKGYTRVQPQYRRYGRIESSPDFREKRIKGLNGLTGFGYVGDHGTYPEMNRSERPSASLVVDTYGGVYEITRQAVINDDSGDLLSRNPSDMGYAAGVFVTQTIVAFIESNPTAPDGSVTYSSGRGNEQTGALSEDTLATAISAMENQLDDDDRPIVVRPRTLAVKNVRLELIANRIIRSQETGATVNDPASNVMDKGTINPMAGILPADGVVRDPYWSDSNDWYLFSDPEDVPGFAVGFLNGNEKPTVLLKNPEARAQLGGDDPYTWDIDSVDFKVRHDFGVAVVDPRGVYRSVVA